MEHCSKCGKALPKIFGLYIDNCYKYKDRIICESCNRIELAEFADKERKIVALKKSTPNNGCNECGSKNAPFFDYEKALWFCKKCYFIRQYGKEKGEELLKEQEELNNIVIFGKIKIYIKEREFEVIPRYQKYKLDNVVSYELIENGCVEAKGGIAGAVLGGVIAGVPGALIGYDKGKSKKSVCSEYRILIRMKGDAPIDIGYVGGGVNVSYDSAEYLDYKRNATETIKGIEYILELIETEKNSTDHKTSTDTISYAEEIMKLKDLMDKGIITESEFEKAKEKLLNT